MRIWEQADPGRDRPIFSWMVQRNYSTRTEMQSMGWRWLPGRPRGVFVTNDPAAVVQFRRRLANMRPDQAEPVIESNGTHAAAAVAMYQF